MKLNFKKGNITPLFMIIFIYILGILVLPIFSKILLNINDFNFNIKLNLFFNFISLFFLLIYVNKTKVNNIDTKGIFCLKKSILIGILGFCFMIIIQIIVGIILFILSKIYNFNYISENTQIIVKLIKEFPLFIIMPVFIAPITEELVFRKAIFGYLYDIMENFSSNIRFFLSAILTGIIFALPHDGFSPLIILYVAMSLVFSYLYVYTKRIISPIIAHILMNTLVVFVQVLGF